jgi:hypothetical protein
MQHGVRNPGPGEDPYEDEGGLFSFDMSKFGAMFAKLRNHVLLLPVVFVICFAVCFSIYPRIEPTYTAVAVIGPPGPSPINTMLATMGGGSAAGMAKKFLGGGGASGANDPYEEYKQLLPSSRLCQALIEKDHILQIIFYKRWDAQAKKWKSGGPLKDVINGVKGALNRPISGDPGIDELMKYLTKRLVVSKTSSDFSSLLSEGAYNAISFEYKDPYEAEVILNTILLEADNVIREDQRRDIQARISFLRKELSDSTITTDERTALISILSDQQQTFSMILADNRYASTLVIPPYASRKPTSPAGLFKTGINVGLASVLLWICLVLWGPRVGFLKRIIAKFERNASSRSGKES